MVFLEVLYPVFLLVALGFLQGHKVWNFFSETFKGRHHQGCQLRTVLLAFLIPAPFINLSLAQTRLPRDLKECVL